MSFADAGADQDADFSAFVRARGTALLRTAYVLTGDAGLAEDLLQSTLTKVYLAWGRLRDPRAAEAYTRRALVRTATSWWRRPSWRREHPTDEIDAGFSPDPTATIDELDAIWRAMSGLSARQRAVITLRYFEDLTEAETARVIGCSVGAVKSHTHRGLSALRGLLEGSGLAARVATEEAS